MNNLLWAVIIGFGLTVLAVISVESAIGKILDELRAIRQELNWAKSDSFAKHTIDEMYTLTQSVIDEMRTSVVDELKNMGMSAEGVIDELKEIKMEIQTAIAERPS